jgi:acetyl esterase/lipase
MRKHTLQALGILAPLLLLATYFPASRAETPFVHIPDTVSPQAAAFLSTFTDPRLRSFSVPTLDDLESWKVVQKQFEARGLERSKPLLERLQPTVTEMELGAVPVLEIKPRGWTDNGKLMIYIHGGAYTLYSARSTLGSAAVMAEATGLRVISIDYTLAPHAQWQESTDQVVRVFKALVERGHAMRDMGIYGDSAGGAMAAGAVLKMRNEGLGMPAVVVLWSPWSDITETGDTYQTLKHAEPAYLYETGLKPHADAYADPKDQKHPYVSPVYGDYSKGFPPTLIQGGTKEILLSNFVRHYQALDTAGQIVKLDLYEGMFHVFQVMLYGAPESNIALAKVNAFLKEHLGE